MEPAVPIASRDGPVEVAERLRRRIDIPDGWRSGNVNRSPLPQNAFQRGWAILGSHRVAPNYVCEVTRIEAGVFGITDLVGGQVAEIAELEWWSLDSDAHGAVALPPPLPVIDWRLYVVEAVSNAFAPPVIGVANPTNLAALEFAPIAGRAQPLWPILPLGLISFSPHLVVVGPREFYLLAAWQQPNPLGPAALPYQLARSWGVMEGRDLRYDTPEARRLVLGGLT